MSFTDPPMRTFCFACRTLLAEVGETKPKGPCPKCGNATRVSYLPGEEFELVVDGFSTRSRSPFGGRWFYKSQELHSVFRRTGANHFVQRVIDRDRNEYHERVIDVETGEVVREVHEPLSDHTGRGSARFSDEAKNDEDDI